MIQKFYFWVFIERKWNHKLKKIFAPLIHCHTTHNSQAMEATEMSINGWMDEEIVLYTHTYMKYYSAIKIRQPWPSVTTWMELEGIVLRVISQRKMNVVWSCSSLSNVELKKKTHRKRDHVCGYQRQRMIKGIGRRVVKMYSFQSSDHSVLGM